MADDHLRRTREEELITEFFLSTSQRRQRVSEYDVRAVAQCVEVARETYRRSDDGAEYSYIPLITGSLAEFSIEPMLPCFGDVDIMCHRSDQLAIPATYRPPTQLPGEFGCRVEVYEIVDSEFPGYVYLERSYLLTEWVDDYNAVPCERLLAINSNLDADGSRHGPALVNQYWMLTLVVGKSVLGFRRNDRFHSVDNVFCVRCLSWPPQAADWPTRHRNYDWPDSATVRSVVSNGCDVVGVAHPLCREDEWMIKHQWRLSFSRAEIVLLNSWMPVQQIVYHMLRHYMKTERLTDSAADDTPEAGELSNYHIKTLMLWACELKSRSWWTDNLNLVRICVELLHTLAEWLTNEHCQHYFIKTCNIVDQLKISVYRQVTTNRLLSITRQLFCEWWIDSYIHKCAENCPHSVSSLLRDASSVTSYDEMHRLQSTISAIFKCSLEMSWKLSVAHLFMFQWKVMTLVPKMLLTLRSCLCWTVQLAKTDRVLCTSFTAIVFLHVAYKTEQDSLTDDMLDVLATACLQSNNVRRCLNARHSSVLSLHQAAILMKLVANSSYCTVQLIEIELAKAYLHRALRLNDCNSDSVYCLANLYLAVLYYKTGQYQMAIDHCTLVMRSHDHSQCSSHVVQGELTPGIDDQVESSLGLAVFYQYVRAAALHEEQERRDVSVFTTELFAHYLHIKLLSATKCCHLPQTSLAEAKRRYRNCFHNSSNIFITDVVIFSFANCTTFLTMMDEIKSPILHQLNTSKLVELLQQSAVEHLSTCVIGQSPLTFVSDFRAMYAYKCGQYDYCEHLSMRNIRARIADRRVICQVLITIPECIHLMDDDLVSFLGLTILVNPQRRRSKANPLTGVIQQLVISLYLLTQCQIKLRHSMTSLTTTLQHVNIARSRIGQMLKNVYDCSSGLVDTRYMIDVYLLKFVEQLILNYTSVS